ncbi:hypothetical protein ACFVAE_14470 [Microbacterium sp. NPDC057659]|uniref:hypothetical protein n=1 Tax=Microbacterium sp. NPDC057659 TaxID=3346198 RepID=UPI00366F77F4
MYDFSASGITKVVAAGTAGAAATWTEEAGEEAGAAATAAAGDTPANPSAIAVDMASA